MDHGGVPGFGGVAGHLLDRIGRFAEFILQKTSAAQSITHNLAYGTVGFIGDLEFPQQEIACGRVIEDHGVLAVTVEIAGHNGKVAFVVICSRLRHPGVAACGGTGPRRTLDSVVVSVLVRRVDVEFHPAAGAVSAVIGNDVIAAVTAGIQTRAAGIFQRRTGSHHLGGHRRTRMEKFCLFIKHTFMYPALTVLTEQIFIGIGAEHRFLGKIVDPAVPGIRGRLKDADFFHRAEIDRGRSVAVRMGRIAVEITRLGDLESICVGDRTAPVCRHGTHSQSRRRQRCRKQETGTDGFRNVSCGLQCFLKRKIGFRGVHRRR